MLLDRNRKIKESPQRFQDSATQHYDIIITCEERCFDLVCDDLMHRSVKWNKPCYVINFDITDTPEDAMVGARSILTLAQALQDCEDLDLSFESIINDFIENKASHKILHSVHFY